MKLVNYTYKGITQIGVFKDHLLYPTEFENLYDLMDKYDVESLDKLKLGSPVRLENVSYNAIIKYPKADILCAGMNYYEHKKECLDAKIDYSNEIKSVYFSKRCSEAKTSGDVIDLHLDLTKEPDYEGELGVILGIDIYKANKKTAFEAIFGYTVINDISARDLQRNHQQFYFGKSLDGYTSIAPILVTRDEFLGYPNLELKTYVNNELRQHNYTSNMIFSIEDMLLELTRGITLKKGTIISTGTPSGIGKGFNPPKLLKPGDEVLIHIEGLGDLYNKFK